MGIVAQGIGKTEQERRAVHVDDALLQEDRAGVECVAQGHDDAGRRDHAQIQPRDGASDDVDHAMDHDAAMPAKSANPTQTLLPKARKHASRARSRISRCWNAKNTPAAATPR